jgi:hypothetical protein
MHRNLHRIMDRIMPTLGRFVSVRATQQFHPFSNCLAITIRWISLVPSPMVQSFTSR